MVDDQTLRDHVLALLDSESAHAGFDRAIDGWPEELRGAQAEGLPYTAWQLLEHLRLAQRTDGPSGKTSRTSGSITTTFVPWAYRAAVTPLTASEKSYSGRIVSRSSGGS